MTEQKDMVRQLSKIMNMLPEQQKTVLQLRDVEGMEYDEIVEITGFEMNYIRVNISRGRKKVKELMQKIVSYEMG
jgi:RNA polymerase sigma-70 factor (ECF subfamily)